MNNCVVHTYVFASIKYRNYCKYIHAHIYFIVAPFNVTIHGSTQYVSGDTLELNCTSEGSPVLQYSWSRETSSEDMFPSDAVIKNNTIIIYNISISDRGHYTCIVSNEAGNFSFTTTINVGEMLYK